MMGPTGVGETEIARRLAKLAKSPFHKVEATKFTEVGYVGRDVESMMDELRSTGVMTGGPGPLSLADRNAFANQLDRSLTATLRDGNG